MSDYSASLDAYKVAKGLSEKGDYSSAIQNIRKSLEALVKLKIVNSKKFHIQNNLGKDIETLGQVYFYENKSFNSNLTSIAGNLKDLCNPACHYDLKYQNFDKEYFENCLIQLERIYNILNVKYQEIRTKKEINSITENFYKISESQVDKKVNQLLFAFGDNVSRLNSDFKIKQYNLGTRKFYYHQYVKTNNINSLPIQFQFAVKLLDSQVGFAGNSFGIAIIFNIGDGKTEDEIKESVRNKILDSIKSNFIESSIFCENQKFILFEKAEDSKRAKIGLFLNLKFNKDKMIFENEQKAIEFAALSYLKLANLLNDISDKKK